MSLFGRILRTRERHRAPIDGKPDSTQFSSTEEDYGLFPFTGEQSANEYNIE